MNSPVLQRFIDALHVVDSERSTEAMTAVVTPDATVLSIDGHGPRRGPDGIAELFTQYVDQFQQVSTTFTRVTETDGRAALEWTSEVQLNSGQPASYTGVTVIEFTDEDVTDFRTVYDSGALLLPPATTKPRPTADDGSANDDTSTRGTSGS